MIIDMTVTWYNNYISFYPYFFGHFRLKSVRLLVDESALASTMTYDQAGDLCASELGPLRI